MLHAALAAERKRDVAPRTSTCRLRSVVRPYDPLSRAYSSLPTRISVRSSSWTTVASTLSREQRRRCRSRFDGAADRRQRRGEFEQPIELGRVADLRELGVIAILLAAARVAPGRLQMRERIGGDPDVGPRRRHHEPANARAASRDRARVCRWRRRSGIAAPCRCACSPFRDRSRSAVRLRARFPVPCVPSSPRDAAQGQSVQFCATQDNAARVLHLAGARLGPRSGP